MNNKNELKKLLIKYYMFTGKKKSTGKIINIEIPRRDKIKKEIDKQLKINI